MILNKPILLSLFTKVWQILFSILSLYFIINYLSEVERGYYYLFISIISLQLFIDMGFTNTIVVFLSHESKNVIFNSKNIEGKNKNLINVKIILNYLIKWFTKKVFLLFVVFICAGIIFFGIKERNYEILFLWTILSFFISINLFSSIFCAFLEGMNKILISSLIRFLQTLFSSIALLITISHFKLYSVLFQYTASLIILFVVIYYYRRPLINTIRDKIQINNKKIIKKFKIQQKKLGYTWIIGYLIFNLYTPFIFNFISPEAAGKFGASIQIASSINAVLLIFLNLNLPRLGGYISIKKYKKSLNLFFRILIFSSILCLFSISFIFFIIYNFEETLSNIIGGLLDFYHLFTLIFMTLFLNIVYHIASFLRMFKKEPFLKHAIVVSVTTIFLLVMLGLIFNLDGVIFAYLISNLVGLIYAIYIFITFKIDEKFTLSSVY